MIHAQPGKRGLSSGSKKRSHEDASPQKRGGKIWKHAQAEHEVWWHWVASPSSISWTKMAAMPRVTFNKRTVYHQIFSSRVSWMMGYRSKHRRIGQDQCLHRMLENLNHSASRARRPTSGRSWCASSLRTTSRCRWIGPDYLHTCFPTQGIVFRTIFARLVLISACMMLYVTIAMLLECGDFATIWAPRMPSSSHRNAGLYSRIAMCVCHRVH